MPDRVRSEHPAALPVHLAVASAVAVGTLAILVLRLYEPPETHAAIAVGSGVTVIALIAYARYAMGVPWLSASIVYLALFWMFHLGLAFTAVLDPALLASLPYREIEWLYWPSVRAAMLLSVVGAAGFVGGLALGIRGRGATPAGRADIGTSIVHERVMFTVGGLLLLVGVGGAVVTLLASGGAGVLGQSYMDFRVTVLGGGSRFPLFLELSQLGGFMALAGATGRAWLWPFLLWSPLGLAMLLVGMRTDALVPLVAFVVILSHRGIHFHRAVLVGGVAVLMVVIPAVRQTRAVGLEGASTVDLSQTSPLETFTELGSTLRAAKAYVDWIEGGDEYLLGASYWAPFDRQLFTRLMPWREPIPIERDERLPERNIVTEGAVGLSATGEAYFNFGPPGPFLFFGLVGFLFGWLERRAGTTPYHCAALGGVMSVLYFNIRSYFLFVPAQTAIALAPLVLCYVIARLIEARHVEPPARMAGRTIVHVGS